MTARSSLVTTSENPIAYLLHKLFYLFHVVRMLFLLYLFVTFDIECTLFEQMRDELMEATAPGEELMGGARRLFAFHLDTHFL